MSYFSKKTVVVSQESSYGTNRVMVLMITVMLILIIFKSPSKGTNRVMLTAIIVVLMIIFKQPSKLSSSCHQDHDSSQVWTNNPTFLLSGQLTGNSIFWSSNCSLTIWQSLWVKTSLKFFHPGFDTRLPQHCSSKNYNQSHDAFHYHNDVVMNMIPRLWPDRHAAS